MPRKPADVVGFVVARVAAAAAAIVIVFVVAGFFLAHQASGPAASWATSSGHDGLWLGPGSVADVAGRSQAGRADQGLGGGRRVRPAGPVSASGEVTSLPPGTASFVSWFRSTFPHVQVCAWLTGTVGRGHLDLDDGATQQALVASARSLLQRRFHRDQLRPGPGGQR